MVCLSGKGNKVETSFFRNSGKARPQKTKVNRILAELFTGFIFFQPYFIPSKNSLLPCCSRGGYRLFCKFLCIPERKVFVMVLYMF